MTWRPAISNDNNNTPEDLLDDDSLLDEGIWKRTLIAAWIAQFFSMCGFNFCMPFIPDFLKQMGLEDKSSLIWSGWIQAAPAMTMSIFGPVWGILADKFGRKGMVMRSMYAGAFILALMGSIRQPGVLLALRFLQGALTGTVTASNALVSSVSPSRKASWSLGVMQTAVLLGIIVGPLLGGVVADRLGYFWAFSIAGILLLIGGILVTIFAEEGIAINTFKNHDVTNGTAPDTGLMKVIARPGFALIVVAVFITQFSRSALQPVFLPFVKQLLGDDKILKTVTGSIFATAGMIMAFVSVPAGKMADRYGPKYFLVAGNIIAGLFCIPQGLAGGIPELYALRIGIGVGSGMINPAIGGLINRYFPRHTHGRAFGLVQSASSLGMMSPLITGYIASHTGLRLPFILVGSFQVFAGIMCFIMLRRLPKDKLETAEMENGKGEA